MILLMTMMMFIFILSMFIMLLASTLSKKTSYDRKKNSPFECGFDPKGSSRTPFSIQFFLIAVIFLIFDVEVTLMLPMVLIFKVSNLVYWGLLSTYFIIMLLLGLYYEWNFGALNWLK